MLRFEHHNNLSSGKNKVDQEFISFLEKRKKELQESIYNQTTSLSKEETSRSAWQIASYPILAILSPVMTTHEEKIEFPGDPMCLYSALSVSIDEAKKSKEAGIGNGPYNDLIPQWGNLPDSAYREATKSQNIREYPEDLSILNADHFIFDPRIWNDQVKIYFINIIEKIKPRVVLISTVSPGFRYAIQIAEVVKKHLPSCLVILGGRHVDETIFYDNISNQLNHFYSSPLDCILDNRIGQIFDFIVAGDGYFALDTLMKEISISMDLHT